MTIRILLVRHGRSEANEANLWQGQGDSPLSATGREQVAALGGRLGGAVFDVVTASDLTRASDTARAVSPAVEVDPVWREMDLGEWEGRTFDEVAETHPDLLEAIRRGEAVAFGETGETIAGFERRVLGAVDALAERIASGGTAMVATHGGVLDAVIGRILGRLPGRRSVPIVTNTSLTVLEGRPGAMRLLRLNDAGHLGTDTGMLARFRQEGVPVVAFVRHGLTDANKEGRIQGHLCWGLSAEGKEQAQALADWYPRPDRVISSPLDRAAQTAAAFGVEVETDDRLMEMGHGSWEGSYGAEVRQTELGRRIFSEGEDLPRGGDGETFADVMERTARFVADLDPQPGHRTVVVTHGAWIRALVAGLHRRGNDINRDLGVAQNSSVTHVAFPSEGPMLLDYAIAPHLGLAQALSPSVFRWGT